VWDWLAGVGDLVAPVVDRLATRVLAAYIVRTDATGLTVLDPTSPAHVQRGSIWAMIGNDRDVLFRYTPSGEGASGPWAFLAGRTGYLQADACNVFDRLFTGQAASAVEFGCWSHGRRRLVALEGPDCRVAYPLKPIARLYRIEHLADARELTPEARRDLRHERAVPVLATLQRWFVATAQTEPPSTDLAKAVAYAVNFWVALTRFVEDGRSACRPYRRSKRTACPPSPGHQRRLGRRPHTGARRASIVTRANPRTRGCRARTAAR